MYKVFINHKPIIFVRKNDLSTEEAPVGDDKESEDERMILNSKQVESVLDLKELLKKVEIDNPLYLIDENPDTEFNRLFSNFNYVEAAGGIVQRNDTFLVIKRKGLWDIPKGKIEKGETPEVACVREILEECGIEGHEIVAPLVNTFHTMKWKGKDALKKTFWFVLNYNGTKKTKPQAEEGITKAKWMTKEELFSIRGNTYGSINEVLDAFGR